MDFSRQETLGIRRDSPVAVVGCGGVGAWVCLMLWLAGIRRLSIFDGDKVSQSNLNRLPLPSSAVGAPKSLAMAAFLRRLRPETLLTGEQDVMAYGHLDMRDTNQEEILRNNEIVIVCTDNLKVRKEVYEYMCKHMEQALYVECGAESYSGSATNVPASFSTPLEDTEGYTIVPVWIAPCAASAAMAVYHALLGEFGVGLPSVGEFTHRIDWDTEKQQLSLFSEVCPPAVGSTSDDESEVQAEDSEGETDEHL